MIWKLASILESGRRPALSIDTSHPSEDSRQSGKVYYFNNESPAIEDGKEGFSNGYLDINKFYNLKAKAQPESLKTTPSKQE